jgi:hypothetical protein
MLLSARVLGRVRQAPRLLASAPFLFNSLPPAANIDTRVPVDIGCHNSTVDPAAIAAGHSEQVTPASGAGLVKPVAPPRRAWLTPSGICPPRGLA